MLVAGSVPPAVSLVLALALTPSSSGGDTEDLRDAARRSLTGDAAESRAAVAALRAVGPRGLQTFLEVHASVLEDPYCTSAADRPRCQARLRVLDDVAGQRGAVHSRLYWHTDLEAAKAAARSAGRPILSLHLLGRLDEDFSCANSRFFRTILYADEGVAPVLRERFVLHWRSLRPAPRVTIDFGDGRRLERTLTGNSVHYVLAPDGGPVDALPGLYGPRAFLAALHEAESVALACAREVDPRRREEVLREWHRERQAALNARRATELITIGMRAAPGAPFLPVAPGAPAAPVVPGAEARQRLLRADRLAAAKSLVERPLLSRIADEGATLEGEVWRVLATVHRGEAKLGSTARRLVELQAPDPAGAIRGLEERLAQDTVRNEMDLHARLHGWFVEGTAPRDLDAFGDRVYRELFLSDPDDPWQGLAPHDVYVALPVGGRTVARQGP